MRRPIGCLILPQVKSEDVLRDQVDSLRLHVDRSPGDIVVVRVGGPLTADTAAPVQRTLSDELVQVPGLMALDLTGVTTIDTAGVDALRSAAMQAGETDIAFCLLGADHWPVGAALARADLTELFDMFTSLDDSDILGAPPHREG